MAINENYIKNQEILNEHLDLVNNLKTAIELIKEQWTSPDDYWHLEITSRKKDLINNKIISPYYSKVTGKGELKYFKRANTSNDITDFESTQSKNFVGYAMIKGETAEEAVNSLLNPTIYFTKWAAQKIGEKTCKSNDGNMKAIIDVCTHFFARAYISLNKRSYTETINGLNQKGYGNFGIDSFLFSKESQRKLMGNEKFKKRPWALIDFDIDDEEVEKSFEDYLANNGVKIRYKLKSHNGTHYLLSYKDMDMAKRIKLDLDRFDIRNLTYGIRCKNDDAVKLEHDNKLLLYSPCGKKYEIPKWNHAEYDNNGINEEKMKKGVLMETVRDSMIKILLESSKDEVRAKMGKKGPLTDADLLDAKQIFKDSFKLAAQVKKMGKGQNIAKIFANDYGYKIWKNYVKGMVGDVKYQDYLDKKGKPYIDKETGEPIQEPVLSGYKGNDKDNEFFKEALPFLVWLKGLKNNSRKTDVLGNKMVKKIFAVGDDMIVGHWQYGFFIANSISTTSPIGLYKLLLEIIQYDNVIFAVTLDMGKQLDRLGLYSDNEIHETPFRGRMVQKKMYATSRKALMFCLMAHQQEEAAGFRTLNKKK